MIEFLKGVFVDRVEFGTPRIFFPKNAATQDINFIAYERESLGILFTAKKGNKTKWY